MKYPDDIDFFYVLENNGWSTCLIYIEGNIFQMGPTHIFENPIEVLLKAMILMLKGADETEFVWHDEPGEYKWSIKRNPTQKHKILISITECLHLNKIGKPQVETLNFEVKLNLFALCILHQMAKIQDLMSEKSYREHRRGEFPVPLFKEYKAVYEQIYS